MNTKTDTQTGRGKLISAQELMEHIGIGRTWLRELMKEGMPCVCLNPNTPHAKLRRYRFDSEAVREWMETRNANRPALTTAETVTAPNAEQKGVER